MPIPADPPAKPAAPVSQPLELPAQLPAEVAGIAVPDEVFDRYAHLVRATLGVPVGLVSLVTTEGQVFPGAEGLPSPWQQTRCTGLSHSFCQHVVARDAPLVITDARQDPDLADNLAIPDIGVIAYAGFPIHAADGTAVGSLCAIDTSPRTWSEHELDVLAHLAATASSELALRAAAQRIQGANRSQAVWDLTTRAAGIGTYVLHLPSQDLEVDDRLLELSGLTRQTFAGQPQDVYAHVHPDDLPDVVARVEHAVATEGAYAAEYRIVLADDQHEVQHADGHRWVAAQGQVLTGIDGTAVALVGAVHDVTAARQATARITAITESMAVGYLAMDTDWRITYVNAEAVHALGRPREQLVGGIIWELFPATVGTDFEAGYRRAAQTGQQVVFDAYYPLNAWYEVRATPEGAGVALYFINITDRYSIEQERQAAAERVRALAEVALALSTIDDVAELVAVMAERGSAALGTGGAAVAIHDPEDPAQVRSYITASHAAAVRADYAVLPLDAAVPVCEVMRTGTPVLLADRDSATAYSPAMARAAQASGSQAFASLPLLAGEQVLGVFTASWDAPQAFDAAQVELLGAFAAQCSQGLQRLLALEGERRARLQAQDAAHSAQLSADVARVSAQRQAALVAIARALSAADSEAEVLAVVNDHGTTLLGATGAGLALTDPTGAHVQVMTMGAFSADVQAQIARLPADTPLPIVRAAIDGTTYFLPDRAGAEALFPGCAELYTAAHTEASAEVPLRTGGRVLGTLSTAFTRPRVWTVEEKDLMEAFAAMTAQALARIAAHQAEQAALASASGIAETLQRSMLTGPPEPDHLQIAVRYAASAEAAEVGGDWYDAFLTSAGLTSVVIGDVTGHDMRAAAVMGQLRNLVRGIGYTLGEPPAGVLAAVDRAAAGLGINTVATAILAQVEQDQAHRAAGTRVLRWSNAGHLPPLLIEADGTVGYLEHDSDLVLGWDPAIERHDHEVVLNPGATVLLYTDGLIERRGVSLERGLAWLAETAAELAGAPGVTLEELCDALLELVGGHLDDDVALLALRAHPEDGPRPAEAGPARVPSGLEAARAAAPEDGPPVR